MEAKSIGEQNRRLNRLRTVMLLAGLLIGMFAGTSRAELSESGIGAQMVGTDGQLSLPHTLSGSVLTVQSGLIQPLKEVLVEAVSGAFKRVAVTGDNGSFQMEGLPAGEYTIRLIRPGYEDSLIGPLSYSGDADLPLGVLRMTPDPEDDRVFAALDGAHEDAELIFANLYSSVGEDGAWTAVEQSFAAQAGGRWYIAFEPVDWASLEAETKQYHVSGILGDTLFSKPVAATDRGTYLAGSLAEASPVEAAFEGVPLTLSDSSALAFLDRQGRPVDWLGFSLFDKVTPGDYRLSLAATDEAGTGYLLHYASYRVEPAASIDVRRSESVHVYTSGASAGRPLDDADLTGAGDYDAGYAALSGIQSLYILKAPGIAASAEYTDDSGIRYSYPSLALNGGDMPLGTSLTAYPRLMQPYYKVGGGARWSFGNLQTDIRDAYGNRVYLSYNEEEGVVLSRSDGTTYKLNLVDGFYDLSNVPPGGYAVHYVHPGVTASDQDVFLAVSGKDDPRIAGLTAPDTGIADVVSRLTAIGDVTGDGVIDTLDARVLQRFVMPREVSPTLPETSL